MPRTKKNPLGWNLTPTGQVSVSTDNLRRILVTLTDPDKIALTQLRLRYSIINKVLTEYLPSLQGRTIHPSMLPTQASGRWSTTNPALTNFPKRCSNPACPKRLHEKTKACWSVRDCIKPFPGEYIVDFDYDAVEARIFSLILNWEEALKAFAENEDIHTPTACDLFNLPYPSEKINPHTNIADAEWRSLIGWRGKDDKRRVIAKNFRYGSQYFYIRKLRNNTLEYDPRYILSAPGIEESAEGYPLPRGKTISSFLISLAKRYIEATKEIQYKRAEMMERIRKERRAVTLFGAPREFYESTEATAKDGFNHMIQGTVADTMDGVIIKTKEVFPQSRLVHNAHDGAKIAFPHSYPQAEVLAGLRGIVEQPLEYENRQVLLTAQFAVIMP